MHEEMFVLWGVKVTAWKLVGYLGVAIFAGRWLIQLWDSRKARKPTFTWLFWVMSLTGSALLLAYFIFGKNDSVGVMSNLFPAFVSAYNLYLEIRHQREAKAESRTDHKVIEGKNEQAAPDAASNAQAEQLEARVKNMPREPVGAGREEE